MGFLGNTIQHFKENKMLIGFWVLVLVTIIVWASLTAPGWDTAVYRTAMHSLQVGHDPYLEATQHQKLVYSKGPIPADTDPPFTYVYPPITLPVLHFFGRLSTRLAGILYMSIYAIAILCQLWVGFLMSRASEKRIFSWPVPISVFFPGLLADGTLLSGNIAHILYALVLVAAFVG